MQIHPRFKFNGHFFSKQELLEVAYSLIKEGEGYEIAIGDFLIDWLTPTDTIRVSTSGSTGTPKLMILQKQNMVNSALATGDFFGLQAGDTSLLCLSAAFIAGKMMLVRAMVLGLEIEIAPPISNPLSNSPKNYDFVAMVPLQVSSSIQDLNQIKTLIIGGAPVSNMLESSLQSVSTKCFETYGMTETITHVAVRALSNKKTLASPMGKNSFEALPNVSFSKDDRGCLIINAPKVSDTPIVTNDLVNLLSETTFEWLGRYDNIINSGGIKLIPEQIEAKLKGLLDCRFFIAGVPDETLGQKVALVLEGTQNPSEIKSFIDRSGVLSKYEIPKALFVVSKFSETKSGKVYRTKILSGILK